MIAKVKLILVDQLRSKKISLVISLLLIFVLILAIDRHIWSDFMYPSNLPIPDPAKYLYSILTANVGNISLGCRDYLNNLCYTDVENRISANIRKLQPDIVLLQELLAPWQCIKNPTNDPKLVCSSSQEIPQVQRLLGDDYSIVCEPRNGFECIAVRVAIGTIVGCPKGKCNDVARTLPPIDGCDSGFTISAATIHLNSGIQFDIVNAHPPSTSSACRAQMIQKIFEPIDENHGPLLTEERVLIAGDFNFDPWRDRDESAIVWQRYFSQGWKGRQFRYHSGIAEMEPPALTARLIVFPRTVDFVSSNFAEGICLVLGESPGTSRLDSGRGMDHRAIFGTLRIAP